MSSFDVVTLFANISSKLAIDFINYKWSKIKNYTPVKRTSLLLDGVRICIERGYFSFIIIVL